MTPVQQIDAKSVNGLLQDGKAVLVDVRSPGEILGGEIPKSVIMPFDLVSEERLNNTVEENKKIVFVCRSGGRATQAAESVAATREVAVLDGGIDAWKKSGLPVASGRSVIPLDRQVQITVGALLIVIVSLTLFLSLMYVLLAGVIGAGLLFAGLTGSCGMARGLLMMPWNKHPLCTSGSCGVAPDFAQ